MQGFASYLFGTFFGYQGGLQEILDTSPLPAYDYAYATPNPGAGELGYNPPSPAPAAAPGPSARSDSHYLRGLNQLNRDDYATASSRPLPAGTLNDVDPADYEDSYAGGHVPAPESPGLYETLDPLDRYDADDPASAYEPYAFPPGSSLFEGFDLEDTLSNPSIESGVVPLAYTPYAPYGYGSPEGSTYTGAGGGLGGSGGGQLSTAAVAANTPKVGIITPNVLREARRHFECPSMERVLLEDGFLTVTGSHWSQRLYEVRPACS